MATKTHNTRGFEPIVIGNCVVQPGDVRYAEPWAELEEESMSQYEDFDTDEDDEDLMDEMGSLYRSSYRAGAPRICPFRSNLVALSQKYNLYFAAYRTDIHVTQPRNVKNTLPPCSDMIIRPLPSASASKVSAALDPLRPHCINHVVIGNLGDQEIILISFDDGDVVAYDTQKIMSCVGELMATKAKHAGNDDTSETPFYSCEPFFHENVGASAWGLAIHENSRLIAVGSNRREVTVFIFALTEPGRDDIPTPTTSTKFPVTTPYPELGSKQPDRSRNQRRVISLVAEGHNIPSLDFSDDKDSKAHSVVAVDILGNVWVLGIWEDKHVRVRRCKKNSLNGSLMGWSVLVLKPGCFKPTNPTPQESLGTDNFDMKIAKAVIENIRFDISRSCLSAAVENRSCLYPVDDRSTAVQRPSTGLQTTRENDTDTESDTHSNRSCRPSTTARTDVSLFQNFLGFADKRRLDSKPEKLQDLLKSSSPSGAKADPDLASDLLPDGSAILRGQKWDVELIPPNDAAVPTVCRTMLKIDQTPEMTRLHAIHRLNMTALIPELSLVVMASQAGRVALLTLTLPDMERTRLSPQPMFRIDCILPFQGQTIRPPFPLLGIAVSPVPDNMAQKRKESSRSAPRRWRLIMHYYDHTILSYELSRGAKCNGLRIL
ncbi:hypothetical protein PVAG01_09444 [Phlyctema vagabunda]|uniref:Uncharacterized protein n=1 Tax=Phlyctema vagabunda TaxID=108571 RepID=A0ABR4P7C9_9HELO